MKKPGVGLTHLRVTLSDTFYLGPGRADLLEGIDKTGSIAEAAKGMGMSYKRAWSLVQALNDGYGAALVETQRGGSGQGANLTDDGRSVLDAYRRMQQATQEAIAPGIASLRRDMSRRK
jgi:molybdate transport system regulatory protein